MMRPRSETLHGNRVRATNGSNVVEGEVQWEPVRSLWITTMMAGALLGAPLTFSWSAFAVFVVFTVLVLLLGHSLGMHRKLVHDSYQCPKWLEYWLVYCGVLVGLAGPLALLRTHDLRDYAQRMPECHDFLGHRKPFLVDGWWQLHCELTLRRPPDIPIEPRIADDPIYCFLQRTWMLQQLPWAVLLYWWGGWGFVVWGVCARVAAAVGGHWLVGYFAHNHGHVRHEVPGAAIQGRNVRFTSLLTMGESWHNNHHAFPGSARIGLYPGEWDPGWWLLKALEKTGLAWGIRLPDHAIAGDDSRRTTGAKAQAVAYGMKYE
jgi:sn-1 stearoyl-lipid 9-desaturase